MSGRELGEHASYLADAVKMLAYRQALRAALVGGGRSVLDLGTGSGILGLIAAQEGAEHVYAVDSGAIVGPAADVARSSDVGDKVAHINGMSTEIDLPERVDVAVCDQIGGFVHDAGVLRYFGDARRRHLHSDGVLIPASFRLFLAPATCTRVRSQIDLWTSRPQGIDFSVFGELAVETEHRIDADECALLSEGVLVASIAADHDKPFTGSGSALIARAGSCDGLVGWFEADLGGGVTLTNHPSQTGRMDRWCNFYPLAEAVPVEPADRVAVDVDVRPLLHAVTWKTDITDGAGVTKANERHSTLLGLFLSPDDLGYSPHPVRSTPTGEAVARALMLADGSRAAGEILAILRDEFDESVVGGTSEETIRSIVRRFTVGA